ncbi:MAG: SagB/ThcOx family dehydrogenase [Pseudomonadota bacterium]
MKKGIIALIVIVFIVAGGLLYLKYSGKLEKIKLPIFSSYIKLPQPKHDSQTSIEKALLERRSVRNYKDEPLTVGDVSQLLWAAQGITNSKDYRTAPSAGATYPLEIYLVAGNVIDLPVGVYKYFPSGHKLSKISSKDVRADLMIAAAGQEPVQMGAIDIVIAAVYERTTAKYGADGTKYADMEVGHAAQNVYLQAISLGLGTVVVGAIDGKTVKSIIGMKEDETPLYLMPVGKK